MMEHIDETLNTLQNNHLPGIELAGNFLFPAYSGNSLLNVPSTICQLLGIPAWGAPPLMSGYLDETLNDIQRVLFLVADGLGFQSFQAFLEHGNSFWSDRRSAANLGVLTSVSPSTTSAALTTLWTGASPAEHGILGYELWLKEFGVVANMISHGVMSAQSDAGGLHRSGFHPDQFLSVRTLGPHLAGHGVKAYSLMPAALAHSGLSTMHLPQVETIPYRSPVDLALVLKSLLEKHAREKMYIYVYWEILDTLSHLYGPDDPRIEAEFKNFSRVFAELFLSQLSSSARRDTLLLLGADHGLIRTQPDPAYDVRKHPQLAEKLHLYPTGENRFAYLYLKPGMRAAVQEYIHHTWPGEFSLVPSEKALAAGLFGPGAPDPRTPDRIGDLLCIAHGNSYLWWAAKENHMLGRHGGLSPTEMLVPFYSLPIE